MKAALFVPRSEPAALEERYAAAQSRALLSGSVPGAAVHTYDPAAPMRELVAAASTECLVVLTDPLLLVGNRAGQRLLDLLATTDAAAVLPVSNGADHPRQRDSVPPYLSLRELDEAAAALASSALLLERLTFDTSNPLLFACRAADFAECDTPAAAALDGREVVISRNDYAHRWASLRAQLREDMLERVPRDAARILELGCGEGLLVSSLKSRQPCRVVGIEIDGTAAAAAATRLDRVHCGDVERVVPSLDEEFDFVLGSEILEHVVDPWSLLSAMRRVAKDGARLLLSVPNVAHASIIGDLLRGRFDYTYMGLLCVGHLRFFTEQTLREAVAAAGWIDVELEPQVAASAAATALADALAAAGIAAGRDELLTTGWYVTAVNRR